MNKPSIFIASSVEGLDVAEAIQEVLDFDLETKLWTQNIFQPSSYILKSLTDELSLTDFGIFIFSPDDVLRMRNDEYKVARDNIVFELGLFMGSLGVENCFIIKPRKIDNFHLPSDLQGLNILDYNNERKDNNLVAALGSACTKIKRYIKENTIKVKLEKQSPVKFGDIFWLNETGNKIINKPFKIKTGYIIAYDIIGFESMNKKYGKEFCDNILIIIEGILNKQSNKDFIRIGDTFILFTLEVSDKYALKSARALKDLIVNYDWELISPNLYVNLSTSVCSHIEPEDVMSWLKRTFAHMKHIKSKNINKVTLSHFLPNKNLKLYDFDLS